MHFNSPAHSSPLAQLPAMTATKPRPAATRPSSPNDNESDYEGDEEFMQVVRYVVVLIALAFFNILTVIQ